MASWLLQTFPICGQPSWAWLHRRSQKGAYGAMAAPKFLEHIVILCFERCYPKQISVIRLKSNILDLQIFCPPFLVCLRHCLVVCVFILLKVNILYLSTGLEDTSQILRFFSFLRRLSGNENSLSHSAFCVLHSCANFFFTFVSRTCA